MLPVHILFGQSFTAKARGMVVREVRCERCQGDYIYQLHRTAPGSAYSFLYLDDAGAKLRAEQRAQKKLHAMLAADQDAVPCPVCGCLQPAMVRIAKRRWRTTLVTLLAFGSLWGGLACLIAKDKAPDMLRSGWFWAAESPLFLLFCLLMWSELRDYNARAHLRTREALGPKCRALPRAEFEALRSGSLPG